MTERPSLPWELPGGWHVQSATFRPLGGWPPLLWSAKLVHGPSGRIIDISVGITQEQMDELLNAVAAGELGDRVWIE